MIPRNKLAFLTACGGGEEYDFFFGTLWEKLVHGHVFLIDTSPKGKQRHFNLPRDVHWFHRPNYHVHLDHFRYDHVLNELIKLAESAGFQFLIRSDCDEYFNRELLYPMQQLGQGKIVTVSTIHYITDKIVVSGYPDKQRRLFPANHGIYFRPNVQEFEKQPDGHYKNGGPAFHPQMYNPNQLPIFHAKLCRNVHLHYAIGQKAIDAKRYKPQRWYDRAQLDTFHEFWPRPMQDWYYKGILPSKEYERRSK